MSLDLLEEYIETGDAVALNDLLKANPRLATKKNYVKRFSLAAQLLL